MTTEQRQELGQVPQWLLDAEHQRRMAEEA